MREGEGKSPCDHLAQSLHTAAESAQLSHPPPPPPRAHCSPLRVMCCAVGGTLLCSIRKAGSDAPARHFAGGD